ncbi:unnamed protein product [Peronospora effusa]|nr:unnamed protein product [Peronospora effusa]
MTRLFSLFLSVALISHVQAEPLAVFRDDHMRHETYYALADRGCALCRNEENCSLAVHNQSSGVFCSDLLPTFQPCCCSFRNECITTIFSDSCECFDGMREDEIMTVRFYLFVGLSVIAWGLLLYDKMCAGPYKVMNSNHQLLASSPTQARPRGEDSVVNTVDNDSMDEEIRTVDGTMAVEVAEELHEIDRDITPIRPQFSCLTGEATEGADVEVVDHGTQADGERESASEIASKVIGGLEVGIGDSNTRSGKLSSISPSV